MFYFPLICGDFVFCCCLSQRFLSDKLKIENSRKYIVSYLAQFVLSISSSTYCAPCLYFVCVCVLLFFLTNCVCCPVVFDGTRLQVMAMVEMIHFQAHSRTNEFWFDFILWYILFEMDNNNVVHIYSTCLTRFNATKHFFDAISWYPTGPISQSAQIRYFVFCSVFEKPIFSNLNMSSTVQ